MSFDKSVHPCSHHYDQDIEHSITPKGSFMTFCSQTSLNFWSQASTNLTFVTIG